MEEELNEENKENKENEENKGLKAKTVSLWGKIIGGVVILGAHILKWVGVLPDASSGEICTCGFAIMGVFGTIDINLMLDKFTNKNKE